MAYGDFKDLARRAGSDKLLRDKAFNIAKNPKFDVYQRLLASKSACNGVNMHAKNKIKQNHLPLDLAEELHKPIIRKFKKRTVYFRFKDIFGVLI